MAKTRLDASALFAAFALSAISAPAFAAVSCLSNPSATLDADNDGFVDAAECAPDANGVPLGIPVDLGVAAPFVASADPNRPDVFVIFVPAASGSLMIKADGTPLNPFLPAQYSFNGATVSFTGLSALNVNVHLLTPDQASPIRVVSSTSPQKAVRVAESLDTNGPILGNCQWGTPNGLDGCVVYTQRILNFINSTCDAAGDHTTDRTQVFLAYITQSFLHESGHSMGGLTATYDSRFGGYHYKSGSGVVMEQSVTYSTKGGICRWNISSPWNPLDASSVKLK